jgi:putative MATE family efflux protein
MLLRTGLRPLVPRSSSEARAGFLLEGPIVRTLFRLAAPNILNLAALSVIVTADAFFAGWLGPAALQAVTLVFPFKMLMQQMAASGMGGAVTAATARAIGADKREHANAVAVHGLIIGGAMAVGFSGVMLMWGPSIYHMLGGYGEGLRMSIQYSRLIFTGAIVLWLFNTLAGIVRGTGNMSAPALVVVAIALLDVVLSPPLMFGWGPFPELGIVGAGVGFVTSFGAGTAILFAFLFSGRTGLEPSLHRVTIRREIFAEILRVGAPASLNVAITNLAVILTIGLVGAISANALAGYGLAARIEYVLIPLIFSFGTAVVTMVAANSGAGQRERAERIAWSGAGVVGAITAAIGLSLACFPEAWMAIFTGDAEIIHVGLRYLRIVAPVYAFYGVGIALYYASQAFGRLTWPVLANGLRLCVAVGGGWVVLRAGGGLTALFAAIAVSFVIYGVVIVVATTKGRWRQAP